MMLASTNINLTSPLNVRLVKYLNFLKHFPIKLHFLIEKSDEQYPLEQLQNPLPQATGQDFL